MSLFMGVSPGREGTRILVTDRDEVRVKASRTYAASFGADWFTDFGGPLYSLEVVEGPAVGLRDRLGGLGSFRDLKQLRIEDALRARDDEEPR